MILNEEQIRTLLKRLKLTELYRHDNVVIMKERGSGYSDDPNVSRIEAALSIMLEAVVRSRTHNAIDAPQEPKRDTSVAVMSNDEVARVVARVSYALQNVIGHARSEMEIENSVRDYLADQAL